LACESKFKNKSSTGQRLSTLYLVVNYIEITQQ